MQTSLCLKIGTASQGPSPREERLATVEDNSNWDTVRQAAQSQLGLVLTQHPVYHAYNQTTVSSDKAGVHSIDSFFFFF